MSIRRRRDNEKGVALVEFAIIVPILITIILGVIDIGDAWFRSSAAQTAVRSAGVTSFDSGNAYNHDLRVIRSVVSELSNRKIEDVNRVVIFNAEGLTSGDSGVEVPASCLSASDDVTGVSGVCTSYGKNFIDQVFTTAADAQFINGNCLTSADSNWCASERGSGDGDWVVGIYVEANQTTLTGMMPGFTDYTIKKTAIVKGWE